MTGRILAGGSLPKTSSSATDSARGIFASANAEWAFLAAIGLLGVIAHWSVHLPLKLPGHHGLEWMALLMFARTMARSPFAATIAATSAAGFAYLPIWGFHEASIGLSYLLAGWIVDALYRAVRTPHAGLLGLCAALAHVAKPVWKWGAAVALGVKFGSVEAGVAYTILCHVLFGFIGGTAGALAGTQLTARLQRSD